MKKNVVILENIMQHFSLKTLVFCQHHLPHKIELVKFSKTLGPDSLTCNIKNTSHYLENFTLERDSAIDGSSGNAIFSSANPTSNFRR